MNYILFIILYIVFVIHASLDSKLSKPIVIPLQSRSILRKRLLTLDPVSISSNESQSYQLHDKRGKITETLKTYFHTHEVEYYITISIGQPEQKFNVIFDTTESKVWVTGVLCQRNCNRRNRYNPSIPHFKIPGVHKKQHFEIIDHDGDQISGTLITDHIKISNLEIPHFIFGMASRVPFKFSYSRANGVLGLSPKSFANFHSNSNFFESLILESLVQESVFGLFLAREGSSDGDSQITFGGYDTSRAKDLKYVKILNKNEWEIPLDMVEVNGKKIISPSKALIHTGTNLLYAPMATANSFYMASSGPLFYTGRAGYYSFFCTRVPSVSFFINGVEYHISKMDLILRHEKDGSLPAERCYGVVQGKESQDSIWVLGTPFLKNVYTVFDLLFYQIGFSSLTRKPW